MSRFVREWGGFVLVGIGVLAFSIGFAFLMTSRSEQHREEFKDQCVQQGGKVVDLDRNTYCIVDGEKVQF